MSTPHLESVAKAVVINSNNQALILTVGEYKSHPEKSFKTDLPGGLVDPGESELTAVIREIYEESGITCEPGMVQLAYAKTEFFSEESKSVTKLLYLARLTDVPEVTLSYEHAEFKWVSMGELKDKVELRPFYKEAITYCFSNELLISR